MRRWARHRWLRRLGLGALGLAVIVAGVFGWALFSTDRSTFARALVWMEADGGDQYRFPARPISAGEAPSPLPAGQEVELVAPDTGADCGFASLDDLLGETDTTTFIVAHDDRLVYERYLDGADRGTLQTSFSVAKPFVSALVGIAIEEDLIGGLDDPVTDYVPELAERDSRFERITLRDLMTMSSGLRYSESGLPWSGDDTYTYCGVDLREVALERSEIGGPPGRDWHYNNYNPLLLGLALERATGMSVSEYMATRLWRPLGAARDATWNLDSEDSGFEKLESGLNATATDCARFGLLYLNGGRWRGRRVVSEQWVRLAVAGQTMTDYGNGFGYFWWTDGERPRSFYAVGNYGQYIYVSRPANAVIVRTGSDWGIGNQAWLEVFRDLSDQLADAPGSG